jgi:hypothetical protein
MNLILLLWFLPAEYHSVLIAEQIVEKVRSGNHHVPALLPNQKKKSITDLQMMRITPGI